MHLLDHKKILLERSFLDFFKDKIINEIIKESFEKVSSSLRIEKEKIKEIVEKLKRYLEETNVGV